MLYAQAKCNLILTGLQYVVEQGRNQDTGINVPEYLSEKVVPIKSIYNYCLRGAILESLFLDLQLTSINYTRLRL